MDRYCLQILNFGSWEDEKTFRYPHQAICYGKETYSQNQWRVYRIDNNDTVHEYDPMSAIEEEARQEIQRMAETTRWRDTYRSRNNALINAAARQREVDRVREEARRNRLRGFNFVGETPPRAITFDDILDDWTMPSNKRLNTGYKIDWRKEGF